MKLKSSFFQTVIATIFVGLAPANRTFAAACCGGGFNLPSVIAGDDRMQLTSTVSQAQVSDDVSAEGVWTRRNNRDLTQTIKLDGATLISDRWQMGASLPLVRRSIQTTSTTSESGVGDLGVVAAYEAWPELEFSPWKPKGYLFSQIVSPTGRSVYESTDPLAADVTGRGFWSLGAGFLLLKNVEDFDFQVMFETHKSLDRDISNSAQGGDIQLHPGWGQTLSLGAGYNLKSWRFGASVSVMHEDAIRTSGPIVNSAGAAQQFATANYQISYLIDSEWATTLAYADQKLLGSPNNTTLSQIWSLALQKRWPR